MATVCKVREKIGKSSLLILLIFILMFGFISFPAKKSYAFCTSYCTLCHFPDCAAAMAVFQWNKSIMSPYIQLNIWEHINAEENWLTRDFYNKFFLKGLAEMTEYLSAFGMYQMEILGYLFDAKHQVETHRLYFQLQAEAHRDYHPSEDFCWYGTNSRSMAASEAKGRFNALTLAEISIKRQVGEENTVGATNIGEDMEGRWNTFIKTFCDPKDNGWSGAGGGLDLACDHDGLPGGPTGSTNKDMINLDVNYTRLVEEPRTIGFNLTDSIVQDEDKAVLAMASNLYGHKILTRNISRDRLRASDAQTLYLLLRSVAAKRSVAQNSFNAIVGMKSAGTSNGVVNTREYMAAAFKDLMPVGTPDADVYEILGENPSYYAQLEFLGKKIYQNPDFYANLYDGPVNVERKRAAIKAVGLMLDRALYESELRQEMVMSVLIATQTRDEFRRLNKMLQTEASE